MTTNSIVKEDLEFIYNSDIDWSVFFNTNILITGANGFIPAYLVEVFLYLNIIDSNNNVNVYCLVRNKKNSDLRFADYLTNKHLHFIYQDVCEDIEFDQKLDFIIHAASQASPKFYGVDPVGTLKANTVGTINVLNLAKRCYLKGFLYFSSSEVYGELPSSKMPIAESSFGYLDPTNVRSCYAESKRMGENICVSYLNQFQIPTKIVRPFHTYGPGMKLDDGRVYADFISNIINKTDICLKSDGSARRAFCYLSDAVIGFIKILILGEKGQAYNIGNPIEDYSILELANRIIALFPEKNVKVKTLIKEGDKNYLKSLVNLNIPDISKAKESLNWEPKISVDRGFSRTVESYIQ